MELVEFNNVNQGNENGNNIPFNNQLQHPQQVYQQQLPTNTNHIPYNPHQHYANYQQAYQQRLPQQAPRFNRPISKHRELPVDVPDSFVGVAKQSPKYPPPKPNRQMSPNIPNLLSHQYNNLPSQNQNLPNNGNNISSYSSTGTDNSITNSGRFVPPLSYQTANHIVNHNSSLRDSIKLKQLEKPKNNVHGDYTIGSMQPAVNKAFELDEDDIVINGMQHQPSNIPQHSQIAQSNKPITNQIKQTSTDLTALQSRLEQNLDGQFSAISEEIKLKKLLSIYGTLIQTQSNEYQVPNMNLTHSSENITVRLTDLIHTIMTSLRNQELTKDEVELLDILASYEMDGAASAFDRITESFDFAKVSKPASPQEIRMVTDNNVNLQNLDSYRQQNHADQVAVTSPLRYNQVPMNIGDSMIYNNMLTISVEKSSTQPLGATIRRDDTTGSIIIARLLVGGAAIQSNLLHEGDEVLEINGIPVTNKSTDEVVNILRDLEGTIDFVIVRRNFTSPNPRNAQTHRVFVKAFFDYQGCNDSFIPCKELCLNFQKGDILEILDQSDPHWWQACRIETIGQINPLAFLVPSISFLKQRERILNDSPDEDNSNAYSKHDKKSPMSILFNCGKSSSLKRRKKSMRLNNPSDEVIFYEEVTTYFPTKFFKRPIIMIGPNSIGRREILNKLLQNSDRFASAVSHTSRPMRGSERNGIDFHFVTRAQFEADIKAGKFIEYGEYAKDYYGTSIDAIKLVVNSKKTCVHLVNGPSIMNFRKGRAGSELKPFFVFVRPHYQAEKLQNIVSSLDFSSHADVQKIIDEAQTIEDNYLPYFDKIITVTDKEQAYQELLREIQRIDEQPQWIPLFWLNPVNN